MSTQNKSAASGLAVSICQVPYISNLTSLGYDGDMTVPSQNIPLQALGRAIKQVQHRHHRMLDQALRNIGSSLAQWDALRAIDQHPEASSHQLAVLTFQTDQAFGELAARMVRQGWITRQTGKGRAVKHQLTPEGESILAQGHPLVSAVLEETFGPLTEPERQTLGQLLNRMLSEAKMEK